MSEAILSTYRQGFRHIGVISSALNLARCSGTEIQVRICREHGAQPAVVLVSPGHLLVRLPSFRAV